MGCDIHFFAEKRRPDGSWEFLPAPFSGGQDGWRKPSDRAGHYRDDDRDYLLDWYDERNYRVFGMLAGVRDNHSVIPVSAPRGWPDDLSPELADERALIEHTPSWLGVDEVMRYLRNAGVPPWAESFFDVMAELYSKGEVRVLFYFDS